MLADQMMVINPQCSTALRKANAILEYISRDISAEIGERSYLLLSRSLNEEIKQQEHPYVSRMIDHLTSMISWPGNHPVF